MIHPFSNFISDSKTSHYISKPSAPTQPNTVNRVHPLPANGYLVKESVFQAPFTMVKDFGKDLKNIGKGLNGDLNDHDLGRLNDVGMKLGGLLIACYLAAKKSPPYQKAMEFVGFGTFFATMALWPKLMIEKPIEWIHGINVHQKYVDSHGRKKMFFQDPQYLPWDLYTHEEIEKMGDKMGIPKELANRQDVIKETAQKKAIQANTLWMWTAGFATPLMTAMACSAMQPLVKQAAENYKTKKATNELLHVEQNFAKYINVEQGKNFENMLNSHEGEAISAELIEEIAKALNGSTTFTAQEPIITDVKKLLSKTQGKVQKPDTDYFKVILERMDNQSQRAPINILKRIKKNGKSVEPEEIAKLLGEIAERNNIKQLSADGINKLCEAFENEIAKQGFKCDKKTSKALITCIRNVMRQTGEHTPTTLTPQIIKQLKDFYTVFAEINAKNKLVHNHFLTFVGEEEDSVLSTQWTKTINKLISDMGFSQKELDAMQLEDLLTGVDDSADRMVMEHVEKIINSEHRYKRLMSHLVEGVSEYDAKLSGDLMTEAFEPLEEVYELMARDLRKIGFDETAKYHVGEDANIAISKLRYEIYEALGLPKNDFVKKLLFDSLTPESILRSRFEEIADNAQEKAKVVGNIEKVLNKYSGARTPLADAIKNGMVTTDVPARRIVDVAIEKLPFDEILEEVAKDKSKSFSQGCRYCIDKIKETQDPTVLKQDERFVSNMPDFIDSVVFKYRHLHDQMIYDGGMKNMIPEWSSKVSAKIPETADRVYTSLIRTVREMFLSQKSIDGNWAKTIPDYSIMMLGEASDLAGSLSQFKKNVFADRQLGARACFYRTIQVFDLMKRIKNGVLEKQCETFVEEYLARTNRRFSTEEKNDFVKALLNDCKKHLFESDISAHTEKFDIDKINRYGGDYYNLVMKALFETDLDSSTKAIMERTDANLIKRFATYRKAVVEQVGNDISRFMVGSHMGKQLLRQGNPFVKHLLIAKSFVKQIKSAVTKYNGGHKWFKIFGTMSAGLVGITLLADAFLLKTGKTQYSQGVEGKNNVQHQLSV